MIICLFSYKCVTILALVLLNDSDLKIFGFVRMGVRRLLKEVGIRKFQGTYVRKLQTVAVS